MTDLPIVAVLGASHAGRGIAQAFAYAGQTTLLVDTKPREHAEAQAVRQAALAEIEENLRALADLKVFDAAEVAAILGRIRFIPRADATNWLPAADFTFEAVAEAFDIKREALGFACRHLRAETVLASTTATFPVSSLVALVTHAERFLNAHWLNPPFLVPLVELSAHAGTSEAVLGQVRSLLSAIGKVPVMCKGTPGYIVSRLQALIVNEAARMVEQGAATPEEIDKAVRYGIGFRFAHMGVMEFADLDGNDTLHAVSSYLTEALKDTRYASPEIVRRHVAQKRVGLRDGVGFYDWSSIDPQTYRRSVLSRMVSMLRYLRMLHAPGKALTGRKLGEGSRGA